MSLGNCPICGSAFKQVPAGVSKKTGKPYNAFIACSKMGCPGKPGQAPQPVKQEPNWDKIREDKKDNIKWLNALNNACLLIANNKFELPDGGTIETSIQYLAEQIYNLEPTKLTEENGEISINNMPF